MTGISLSLARAAAVAALMLSAPLALEGQDSTVYQNHLYDKFQVGIAFTTVINRSSARIDGANGNLGTEVDFREAFGLSETSVQPAIGIRWKPGRRTEFDLGFQALNQSGQRTVDDNFVINGDTVYVGLQADTKVSSDNLAFQFKYSIWAAERHNIGVAIGLGAIFFGVKLDAVGDGSAGGGSVADTVNIDKSFVGPTAAIGAFGQWRLGDRWYLTADARGIGGRVDRYDISVFEGALAGQYFLSNHWGLNLSFFYTDVTVDVGAKSDGSVTGDLIGKLAYNYSSIWLGVLYAF